MSKQIYVYFCKSCVDIHLLDNSISQALLVGLPYDSYKLVTDSAWEDIQRTRLVVQLGTSLCSYVLDDAQVHSFREQHQLYVDGKSDD